MIRRCTEALCEPLAAEDYVVQSMPDASPVKWHLAHTTWFFETFLLAPHLPGYRPFHPQFRYLFNSYYQGVGPRWPRAQRGLLSRPTVLEVFGYRAYVDKHLVHLLRAAGTEAQGEIATTVLLGLHHEQQHQELVLTDLKHAWAANPLQPVYREAASEEGTPPRHSWLPFPAGLAWIGHHGRGFAFDNESPRHRTWLNSFQLASRLVTNAEYLAFVRRRRVRPARIVAVRRLGRPAGPEWEAPLYWAEQGGEWSVATLSGPRRLGADEPVCHVSYYEADAFCAVGRRPAAHRGGVGNGRLRRATGGALPGGGPLSPRGIKGSGRPWTALPALRGGMAVDGESLRRLPRLPPADGAPWASTTANSCATS